MFSTALGGRSLGPTSDLEIFRNRRDNRNRLDLENIRLASPSRARAHYSHAHECMRALRPAAGEATGEASRPSHSSPSDLEIFRNRRDNRNRLDLENIRLASPSRAHYLHARAQACCQPATGEASPPSKAGHPTVWTTRQVGLYKTHVCMYIYIYIYIYIYKIGKIFKVPRA